MKSSGIIIMLRSTACLVAAFFLSLSAFSQDPPSANVGIGTPTPTEKLDVNGNINLSGELKINGVAGEAGQMIQSNGNGSMEWTDGSTTSGGIGYGTWGDCAMAGLSEYYPVSDPLGETGDAIGISVAICDDYSVIAASYDHGSAGADEGSVTVMVRDPGTGLWVIDGNNKLYNSNAAANDRFGNSVGIDGLYMIVGASMDDESAGANQGTASIFIRNESNGIWEFQSPKLTNPGASAGEQFGYSVDVSGNYVIIGAPYDDYIGGTDHGSASIFVRDTITGIWSLDNATKLIDSDYGAGDHFGKSVSISGTYAIIGAPKDDDFTGANEGTVSFYEKHPGTGIWNQVAKFASPSAGADYQFGYSVSIDGDYAIVGAPFDESAGVISAGAAYVYRRSEYTGTWQYFGSQLLNPDIGMDQNFGFSVSISGNYALVGSYGEDTQKGSATLFANIGPSFQGMQKVTDPWGSSYDNFGYSVGVDGSSQRFIIGAYGAFNFTGKTVYGKY